MLLAIDTATQVMSLALHDGRSLLAEQTWHTANNHTLELTQGIHQMLARCGVDIAQVTALGVSVGPGSYSGLRVGVATAKGIAAVRGLPVIGVSALDTLAAAQPHVTQSSLIAVVQAGRERIVVGRYQWRKGRWGARGTMQLMDWETLIASVDGAVHVTGEVNEGGYEALRAAQERGVPITLTPAVYRLRRAGFLAEEAWTRYHAAPSGFPADRLVPIYIKTQDVP
ncbi:MAG: tRNA (adenosine(37)-N6)-threonylcarbamoyltransferase complex dimerization subunit type 1 TsaB [Anaerolineae bacterium]|nr:tRNA (adenosine(37)-N6)-threonylcarbamoyltransferase complex dimerization subunit type 1 TsaB [Anaerolineae bacterium]